MTSPGFGQHPGISVLRGYNEQGKVAVSMPVVVGRALRTETPVMEEDMKYLNFLALLECPAEHFAE